MCGRTALFRPPDVLAEVFEARQAPGLRQSYEPSYNIAPSRAVVGLAVTPDGERVLDLYRWGLVPSWARQPSIGNRLFNARAETIWTRPAFSAAMSTRRLAVLADGFFEWHAGPGGRRRPLYFQRTDGEPLAFAGLWEAWRDPAGGRSGRLLTCTVVTTVAGADLAGVHDRMPAILEPDGLDVWLAPTRLDRQQLEECLGPAPPGTLARHPVDPRVGDAGNDGPDLVAPFDRQEDVPPPGPEPLRLFDAS